VVEGPNENEEDRLGQPGLDQRRLFITTTIVGVAALLLGWVVGRAEGSDEVATTRDSSATTATTQQTRTPLLPEVNLPTPDVQSTIVQVLRTTTTTMLVPPTLEEVELDPRLAGIDLTLVGVEQGELVELDLATQTLTRRDLGRVGSAPQSMIVGADWVVLTNQSGMTNLVHDDGRSEGVDLGDAWQLLWQPGTDRFWRPSSGGGFGPPSVYDEVDLSGASTGARLELPANTWSWQVDPGGGLIVVTAGKIYSVNESSTEFIGSGELLGLSADLAVVRDCDEQLRCALFVIDRMTGSVREVGGDQAVEEIAGMPWIWGAAARGSISPNGTMCVVVAESQNQPVMGLLDLISGAFVPLRKSFDVPSVVWSPDGRFAFFVDGLDGPDGSTMPGLRVYDRQTDEIFSVMTQPARWDALSVRPANI